MSAGGFVARVAATAFAVLAALDVAFAAAFPTAPRLAASFSAAYLQREVRGLRAGRPVVVLGDSAVWGYGIAAREAAVSRLRAAGRPWVNLAYEGGSPANTYAMLRVLRAAEVRPAAIVFNVNLKEFNPADSAYRTLYPAVERLAWERLAADERAKLVPVTPQTLDARLDRAVAAVWTAYAMRADLRDALFGAADAARAVQAALERVDGTAARAAAAHRPSPDRFEGTYDLSPLDAGNVSVFFLRRALAEARATGAPVYAVLTPTNHALLHDFIDVPEYGVQLAYVRALVRASGAHVLDYDGVFSQDAFIDNDHLTAAGNARLARRLARDVPE